MNGRSSWSVPGRYSRGLTQKTGRASQTADRQTDSHLTARLPPPTAAPPNLRLHNALHPMDPSFTLTLLHVLTAPLHGLANAFVFGLDRDTWDLLSPTGLQPTLFLSVVASKLKVLAGGERPLFAKSISD
ncbi:unnamed protein product [Merluccius merluccius]